MTVARVSVWNHSMMGAPGRSVLSACTAIPVENESVVCHIEAAFQECRTGRFIHGAIVQGNERVTTETHSIVTMRSGNQFKQCAVTVDQGQTSNQPPRS